MGKCYSDAVEQALEYVYYKEWLGKGQEGFALLKKASEAGDGDASCLLGRCLNGEYYVWPGHRFPMDEHKAEQYIKKGVEQGSALAVLVAMRCGVMKPALQQKMPFASLQEAFDVVLDKAKKGDAFSQYTIGNSYFWWDFLRIQGKSKQDFPSHDAFRAYLRDNISQCEDWFWKAFRGGIYYAGNNLRKYYSEGDEDIIPPQPEKGADILRMGAEYGYPTYLLEYAHALRQQDKEQEAIEWFRKAGEAGELSGWFFVGQAYVQGRLVQQDYVYAVKCFEKALDAFSTPIARGNSYYWLGWMYYAGCGVEQDYAKAIQLFTESYQQQELGGGYLAECYLLGKGTEVDVEKGRKFLDELSDDTPRKNYILGCCYANGIGVPQDIKTGVQYLQKAGNMQEAKEELLHYKKTLFGKWVRR